MKLWKKCLSISFLALALSLPLCAADITSSIGVVSFKSCVEKSKCGQKEQVAFEDLKKQMDAVMEKKETELNKIAAKFNDPDYMDSLSTEAEAELKHNYRALSQEIAQQQNQYYQLLNQANMKVVQALSEIVQQASEKVAKQKGLSFVLNEEACYFFNPSADVTALVVAEMDKMMEETSKAGK